MRPLIPAVAIAAAALALAACSSHASSPGSAASTAAAAAPSPTFTALPLAAACKLIRTDALANGGTPDIATLQQIVNHATDGQILSDAQKAEPDVRKGDGLLLGFDMSFFAKDCRSTGVQIPVPNQ